MQTDKRSVDGCVGPENSDVPRSLGIYHTLKEVLTPCIIPAGIAATHVKEWINDLVYELKGGLYNLKSKYIAQPKNKQV